MTIFVSRAWSKIVSTAEFGLARQELSAEKKAAPKRRLYS
jgi:hypothetical protein